MEINRENYGAYFIDYLEGNLNDPHVDEFLEFLQQNPDLKGELKNYSHISVEAENKLFRNKKRLYKQKLNDPELFEIAASAYIDGELNPSEESELLTFLKNNPEKETIVASLKRTKLNPDTKLYFGKKTLLHQQSFSKKLFFVTSRVAAVFILLFAISLFFNRHKVINVPEKQIVDVKITKKPQNKISTTPPVEPKKKKVVPKVKSAEPEKPKQKKSLREKTKGRIDEKLVAEQRQNEFVFPPINTKNAVLTYSTLSEPLADLSNRIINQSPNIYSDERPLLAQKIKTKARLNGFSFNKITKAGLNLAASISKNKFTYETNDNGQVTEYNLDTHLLAFSIPTRKKQN